MRGVDNALWSEELPDEREGLEKSKDMVENVGLRQICGATSRHRRDMSFDTAEDRKG